MSDKEKWGYKELLKVPGLQLSWLGSWDRASYSRFGKWRSSTGGWVLRYRAYLLNIGRQGNDALGRKG